MKLRVVPLVKLVSAILAILVLLGVKQLSAIWAEKTANRLAPPPTLPVKVDLPSYDIKVLKRHVRTRLPLYRVHFQQAAEQYGLSWTLLAAQGYQESHWNRKARSPTGVRGLMMLTKTTAASLGVTNRLDPVQSIRGGAKYLAKLRGRLPKDIQRPNRTFIALAAYNVGMGHVKDARTLAVRQGKDPNRWPDLRTVLPLLTDKRYYKTLRYGYARGHETVHYVKRIRAYLSLLERPI